MNISTELIAFGVFIVGYIIIVSEHKWYIHKAITAVALGAVLWLLIALRDGKATEPATLILGGEIFGLVIFLLAAMTLVEILIHYGFFDLIRVKLLALHLDNKVQIWVTAFLAFFLSAVIDNLTATIVMTQIALRFYSGKNLLTVAAAIIIAANAGGVFSPVGDITTIMLWLAGKFSSLEIIIQGFLPSLSMFLVSIFFLSRNIVSDAGYIEEEKVSLLRSEKAVIAITLISFSLPLVFSQLGLPPYFGLLFGLGCVGLTVSIFRVSSKSITHLDASIEKMLVRVDFASLLFFAGILLAVGALEYLGILEHISEALFGEHPAMEQMVFGNAVLGVCFDRRYRRFVAGDRIRRGHCCHGYGKGINFLPLY
ncbi:MAG: Citrate transporter [Parcubacteria group bacterium GW2011_GWB1_40_14]|nr:MAG: Citrate transporter [Parcubacteria group bacterium GW2011_GWB1_40_14]